MEKVDEFQNKMNVWKKKSQVIVVITMAQMMHQ